jgi:hypothetical protein
VISIGRVLGLAAVLAAARAAWLHHQDSQLVIRTDLMRDSFAAGQAAERTRAAEAAATARAWTPSPAPNWLTDYAREMRGQESDFITWTNRGPIPTEFEGGQIRFGDVPSAETWLPEEPEGPGWTEHDDRYGGTSR